MTAKRTLVSLLSALATLALAGCNLQQTAPISVGGSAFHGSVYGGNTPIIGSSVQLYAAGSSGYGSAYAYPTGSSLLGSNIVQTTGPSGSFSIAGDYTCPSASTPVYLVATGGNPGISGKIISYPQIALMAALGPCGSINPNNPVTVNEVTTVASVWALSPFMNGISNVGSSPANIAGLTNAFATVGKLVNVSTGTASGPALPVNATLPVAKIDTLANILAACVNSVGGVAGDGSSCGNLFADTSVNGVAPTDTIAAALNLAKHPAMNTAALFLIPGGISAPFQPSLSAPPTDYRLVVTYTGGGLATPSAIAADPSGNIWTANRTKNSITVLDAQGITASDPTGYLSGTNGYKLGSLNLPSAIALDTSGNAWITNGNNTVTQINAAGTVGTVFSGANINAPSAIAIDAGSNVWVANSGNATITEIGNTGVLSNYPSAGIVSPTSLAIHPK